MSVIESQLHASELQPVPDIPVVLIEPSRSWLSLNLGEFWAYRELLYFLVWRDVKVRYKQTAIGIGWTILQPLLTMVIFTLVFGRLAKVPSDGLPYPVFAYTALLPWNLFAGALNRCTVSLVASANLITKVYFPRLIVPASATISGIIDFAIAFVFLLFLMLWFHIVPTWGAIALPIFLFLTLITVLAVGLWLSALNVRYRDVGHAIPFLIQIWMFLSPVAYPASLVPERWRMLYSLNPMVGVIEGFRWALLGKEMPDLTLIAVGTAVVTALLIGGLIYFKRIERTFADVV